MTETKTARQRRRPTNQRTSSPFVEDAELRRAWTSSDERGELRNAVRHATTLLCRYASARLAAKGVPASVTTAEDIVQEAWLETASALPNTDNPYAYLRKTVDNKVARAAQVSRRAPVAREIDANEHPAWVAAPASVGGLIEHRDAVRVIASAIAMLPPQQRRAAYLRFVEDCSGADIAVRLNVTVSTAGVLVFKARKALMAALIAAGMAAVVGMEWHYRGLWRQHVQHGVQLATFAGLAWMFRSWLAALGDHLIEMLTSRVKESMHLRYRQKGRRGHARVHSDYDPELTVVLPESLTDEARLALLDLDMAVPDLEGP